MLFFKKNDFIKQRKIIRKYHLHSADVRCGCKKGLISVVLPVYNGEKYLEESINSVLSQTYANIELIIVNDGSTDNSGKIADTYAVKDNRIRVIHQSNLKLPAALNTGFKNARGEFLTWTSADNRMLPSCLETLSSELIRNRNIDMVFGNMRLIDESGNILRGYGWYEFPPLSGNVILPDDTSKLNTIPNNTIGAAFMYRMGAQAVIGEYSEDFYTLEDYDFFMRMNFTFNIRHIMSKKPIYEYRIHNESLTARDKELKITESRPALMSLDKRRREDYLKPLYCYIDGNDKLLEKEISSKLVRINSPKTFDSLISKNKRNYVYINIGNVPPSINNKPYSFLIHDNPINAGYEYNSTICRNSSKLKNAWVSPVDETAIAHFIFHKAKNI